LDLRALVPPRCHRDTRSCLGLLPRRLMVICRSGKQAGLRRIGLQHEEGRGFDLRRSPTYLSAGCSAGFETCGSAGSRQNCKNRLTQAVSATFRNLPYKRYAPVYLASCTSRTMNLYVRHRMLWSPHNRKSVKTILWKSLRRFTKRLHSRFRL
jgi:hypothetical protein